ncbi:FAD-dependent monooxygenase [Nocardia sp. NPDC088792]|uniref:FAD-dependent monooxygenase n=1 Tax=Nocardia sp. NPDC088792 TaxID=3364332 RepID=UPI00382F5252
MVTILGGGIAGTALGAALAHRGHPAVVYERRPDSGTGAFMVLDGNAERALVELGADVDALHKVSYPMSGGFKFHYRPEGGNSGPSRGHRLYPREGLMRVLDAFAADAGADIRRGVAVTDIEPTTGIMTAGTTVLDPEDGVVIAADGIDSLARARIEPGRPAVYAGQVVFYGTTVRRISAFVEPDILHFHGRLVEGRPLPVASFGHLSTPDGTYWFARLTRPAIALDDIGTHPVSVWAAALRAADPAASELIDAILAATDTVHAANCRAVPLNNALAPRGPVTLCGDADHAVSPAAAIGAGEALEDALALTRALTSGGSAAEAMAQRRIDIGVAREKARRRVTAGQPRTAPEDHNPNDDPDQVTRMWGFN